MLFRSLSKTHADILRAIAFQFKPFGKKFTISSGLFGAISYDFIDQFEKLPKNRVDALKDPDYEMLFLDNVFIVDHLKKKITLIANAFKTRLEDSKEISRCLKKIEALEKKLAILSKEKPAIKLHAKKLPKLKTTTSCSKKEYISYHPGNWELVIYGNESSDFKFADVPYLKAGVWGKN